MLDRPTILLLLACVSVVACAWLSLIWLRLSWKGRQPPSLEEWMALIEGEDQKTVREWIDTIRSETGKR